MTVIDHPVHEKVRHTSGNLYSCKNRKQEPTGYFVLERQYKADGTYVMRDRFIPHNMSKDCRSFYLWYTDENCASCTRKKDREYAEIMRHL